MYGVRWCVVATAVVVAVVAAAAAAAAVAVAVVGGAQTAPPLLPMLVRGQDFIEEQDELSVTDFMRKWGRPPKAHAPHPSFSRACAGD